MQMASSLGLPFLPATFGQYAPSVFGHYNLALTMMKTSFEMKGQR